MSFLVAQELGNIPQNNGKLQVEIERLNLKSFITLEQVEILHDCLDGQWRSRQSSRLLGELRTGKTIGCDAYLTHKPKQGSGKPPTVHVAYIQIPQECSAKENARESKDY